MIPGWAIRVGRAVAKGLLGSGEDGRNILKAVVFIILGMIALFVALITAFPTVLLYLPLADEDRLGMFYDVVRDYGKDKIEIPWEEVAAVWGALYDQDYSRVSRAGIEELAGHWVERQEEKVKDEQGKTHTKVTYILRGFDDVMDDLGMTDGQKEQAGRLLMGLKSGGITVRDGWTASPAGGWLWPVPAEYSVASRITCPYGYRMDPIDHTPSFHHGVDIGVPEGTAVYAVRKGTIRNISEDRIYGINITLQSGMYIIRYAHLSGVLVNEGDAVKKGEIIARSGNTGRSTGPHLHFEVKFMGKYVNPLNFY
ncbi:M23 family metallopeptidase [Thermoanaerobacterium sp. DL9XJH110]|uniref:M23 family metallopeptidase n=1 Tax=Thermoanaerobacterium sp. DL9XJH110 TaxID=3386643 RepID=UPI003BB51716